MVGDDLAVSAIRNDSVFCSQLLVFLFGEVGESPLAGHKDFLSSGEFELGSSECLDRVSSVGLFGSNGEDDLVDVDSCNQSSWFAEGSSHTSLKSICSCTRKHFVDSNYVPWVNSNSHVETILSCKLGDVLVGTDTSSFQSFAGNLFFLAGNKVHAERKVVDMGLLSAKIINSNLCVWNTTAVTRLNVWLAFTISVASVWSSTHCGNWMTTAV